MHNKEVIIVLTCTGQTLRISSTREACSHRIPWGSAPPPRWCGHSGRSGAEFWSARPEFRASPARFAPSLCCRGGFSVRARYSPNYSFFYQLHAALHFYTLGTKFGDELGKDCTIIDKKVNAHNSKVDLNKVLRNLNTTKIICYYLFPIFFKLHVFLNWIVMYELNFNLD